MTELVNHPAHYNSLDGLEAIDFIENFSGNLCNGFKYLWRIGLKPGEDEIRELKKAQWYFTREYERRCPNTHHLIIDVPTVYLLSTKLIGVTEGTILCKCVTHIRDVLIYFNEDYKDQTKRRLNHALLDCITDIDAVLRDMQQT